MANITGKKIDETARAYVGSGCKRFIDAYKKNDRAQKWINYNTPWCCIFVWYIFATNAASKLFYDGKKTAACDAAWYWCRTHLKSVSMIDAKPGDIIFFDWNNNNSPDHIGFVDKAISYNTIQTVEGNTNGGVVAIRTRVRSNVLGIYRPKYPDDDTNRGIITINRRYEVVNPRGADARRGASMRYTVTQHFPKGKMIHCTKMFQNGSTLWLWTPEGKTGWIPLKHNGTIYLHVR